LNKEKLKAMKVYREFHRLTTMKVNQLMGSNREEKEEKTGPSRPKPRKRFHRKPNNSRRFNA
jgi:hypothetical protein